LHPWNFATVRSKALAALSDAPDTDYDYYHQIPSDCLRVLKVSDGTNDIEEYEIEGRKIASNYDVIYIKYIQRVTDPNQWDAMFVAAFAARIASELAFPITKDKTLAINLYKLSITKKRGAKSVDAQESSKVDTIGEDEWTVESRQ
jgi:hypothetical protein